MAYKYFSQNGSIRHASKASVPLNDIHYAYGFGVYETVRVVQGTPLFLEEHCRRLMESARIIGLDHMFTVTSVADDALKLIDRNDAKSCNLKIMLVGDPSRERSRLYILCLNPLFPDRKLYKRGVHVITRHMERPFPHAKTLNMLPSYLANRDAKAAGAYDALLIDRHDCVTEGTSTNFFAMKGRDIFSPPASDILPGVTREKVLQVAHANGFTATEKKLPADSLTGYDDLFLTGTSIKVMPISSIDDTKLGPPSPMLHDLMRLFDDFLKR